MRYGTVARWLVSSLGLWLIAGLALAHPSPAEAPEFFPADCIVVVDKQQHASWHLEYAVVVEDTEPELDHVSLADSKTHQFFALAGTLLARASDHVFLPFDDREGRLHTMPTWLTAQDVMRTAAGVTAEDMTAFTADQVGERDVLENDALLSGAVRPLVAGTVRVPITEAQATAGVDWDLTDVPPGVYQIAAYIFSPPYNGWAPRSGLIKVIDGADESQAPAAVTLEPVAARLFAGQGRRVRGCVDAPPGSMLQLMARAQAEIPAAFEPSITQPVTNGPFELCLTNDGVDEALELRVEVRTPAGLFTTTQSSDAISLFSNEAACVASEALCCPDGLGPDAGGSTADDASTPMTPERPGPVTDAGNLDQPIEPQRTDGSVAENDQPTQPTSDAAPGSSCQCRVAARRSSGALSTTIALLALCLLRRRVR
jgi:hypothetical protein